MKPFQQIDQAKAEAEAAIMKLAEGIQKIADDFRDKTGGVITGVNIHFNETTSFGDDYRKTMVTSAEVSVSK